MDLSKAFGIHEQAVLLRSRRSELLARNLANAETPNFKSQDIDFRQAMTRAADGKTLLHTTQPNHLSGGNPSTLGTPLMYRVPNQPSVDGNTVDLQAERSEFTKNAMQYQASLRFLSGRIAGLLSAIKGE